MAGFDPKAKRDRNLVNRELSDLAGMSPESHSKPSPQLITRVGRGRYIFNELNRPMDLALVRGYLEPEEAYEKRPARRRVSGIHRGNVSDSLRMALYAVQQGVCPGCGFYQPHYLRFEADHVVALADGGGNGRRNVQLLCSYCNRVKGTQGQRRVTAQDGGTAGGQRGHGGDGGREAGGDHRPPVGPASPGAAGAMTPWPHISMEKEHVRQIQPDSGPAGVGGKVRV